MKVLLKRYSAIINFAGVSNRPLRYVLIGLRIYLIVGLILFLIQYYVLFQPGSSDWDNSPIMDKLGAKPYTHEVGSSSITGWKIPKHGAIGRVYVFHGNAGHASDRSYWVNFVRGLNVEIILVEYPGYDGSDLTIERLLKRSISTFDFFQSKNNLPAVAIGESLGTGVATHLARKRNLAGLVLYAPYPSLEKVAFSKLFLYPVQWMFRYNIPAEDYAPGVEEDVLAIHGTADSVIPYRLGQAQAKNFPNAKLISLEGANHNDWLKFIDGEFVLTLQDFISSRLTQAKPKTN